MSRAGKLAEQEPEADHQLTAPAPRDLFKFEQSISEETRPHDQSPDREARRIELNGVEIYYEDPDPWLTIASVSGLPSTIAPIKHSKSGLPIAVKLIGPHMGDRTSIAFAGHMERKFGEFSPPPKDLA